MNNINVTSTNNFKKLKWRCVLGNLFEWEIGASGWWDHRISYDYAVYFQSLVSSTGLDRLNLTSFANGNSINAEYYAVLCWKILYAFIILRSWMVTIIVETSTWFSGSLSFKIRATLLCFAARPIITNSRPCFISRSSALYTSWPKVFYFCFFVFVLAGGERGETG